MWAHSPLRAAARPNFTLPFTRCRYCRTLPLSHAACASMSTTSTTTTTTTTTRDRGDRYGPIKWAQRVKSTDIIYTTPTDLPEDVYGEQVRI